VPVHWGEHASTFYNPKGWKMVAGGRGGRGARPPEYGTPVGCTPAGVPEPLSPCRVTSASGTPPGCSPTTRRLPGGRYPFAPERPPATICQPFGLKHRGACFRGDSKVDAHTLLKRGVNERPAALYLRSDIRKARICGAKSPRVQDCPAPTLKTFLHFVLTQCGIFDKKPESDVGP